MGVSFDGTNEQGVDFGALSVLNGLTSFTAMLWMNLDAYVTSAERVGIFGYRGNMNSNYAWFIAQVSATGLIRFDAARSSTQGTWQTNSAFGTSSFKHLAISYNTGATTNDPIIYIDGSSVAITETSTPVGSLPSGTSHNFFVSGGSYNGSSRAIDGIINSPLVYNRILSAAEILEAYNSRKAIPTYNGLVFAPQLNGAAGLQTFGGATLAAGNTIVDSISGAIGTPSGSPIGVGDTILTYGG